MRSPARRFALFGVALLVLAVLAPAAVLAADPSEAALKTAEASALTKINKERTDRGLVKLRLDPRIAELARERAVYMASRDILSHEHAGGLAVWDMMSASGIIWYGAGEIIAYNTTSSLAGSATTAVHGWMGSPPHKSIMLSTQYNYIGMGLAVSPATGRRYWAGVFLKGPDRTGAWAKIGSVSRHATSATKSRVTIHWSGADTKLQVLTSGFRYFQTQRRYDDHAWFDYGTTTSTSTTRTWTRGHVWQFRVRARDKAGNWGGWKTVTITL
jgi:uncharacterized protein YkwD